MDNKFTWEFLIDSVVETGRKVAKNPDERENQRRNETKLWIWETQDSSMITIMIIIP